MTHPAQVDVTVIGASAAGLLAAELLARAGRSVCVLERAAGLGLSERVLIVTSRLGDILGPAVLRAVTNEIQRFEMHAEGRSVLFELGAPDLIVERSKLIGALAVDARAAGVAIEFGCRFTGLRDAASSLAVTYVNRDGSEHTIQTGSLVGADGAFSKVAKAAGWGQQPTVPLVQAIVDLPAGMRSDDSSVWFVPEETPYFFWLIPESEKRAAVGVIGDDGTNTRTVLDRFLRAHGLTPIEYQAARIPRYDRWIHPKRSLSGGDIYLVGDAAGQVKVSTVGGVVTGLQGAKAAVDAMLDGGSLRHFSRLRRELDAHLLMRRALSKFGNGDYQTLLRLASGRAGSVLAELTRDDAVRMLWRLPLAEPRLLWLAGRGLLRR